MVPLTSLTKFESRDGPRFTMSYNESGRTYNGSAAPGTTHTQATSSLEYVFQPYDALAKWIDYMGMSYQESKARGESRLSHLWVLAPMVFSSSGRALLRAVTAFSLPPGHGGGGFGAFHGLVVAPRGAHCFLSTATMCNSRTTFIPQRRSDLIGSACPPRTRILIVEFAKERYEDTTGTPLVDAALDKSVEASTASAFGCPSFAFILGCCAAVDGFRRGLVARKSWARS